MARIKKGDTVTVLSGKDRGKTGKVLQILAEGEYALVERVNLAHHFDRKSQQNPAGGVVEREGALHLSKLALVCAKCRRASRAGWTRSSDGTKQRICRRCNALL